MGVALCGEVLEETQPFSVRLLGSSLKVLNFLRHPPLC